MAMLSIVDRQYPAQVISSILSNHLRVTGDDGELYEAAKASVYNAIAAAEMFTNRVLIDSIVTITLDDLDSRVIELPTAPVREIVELRYRGEDGEWHTMTDYTLHSNAMRARLELADLPMLYSASIIGRVEIEATCGFEDAGADIANSTVAYPLPGAVEQAIILLANAFLEGDPLEDIPTAAQMLLKPYRIIPYGL